ncbi:polysaccharide deacetylase family protein [Paenibacillus sp. Marseille-Q7038]
MPKILSCYPEGKLKALTMSYDDGVLSDRRLASVFNENGIKGTFHINSGMFGDTRYRARLTEEESLEVYQGHEVSVHTVTHPSIARCPKEQVLYEIMDDRKNLERLFGYPVRGMSYPNGSYSQEIIEMLPVFGIEYARVVQTTGGGYQLPENFLEWKATCHHNQNLMQHAETFVSLPPKNINLMYVWGHSYEFDDKDNWDVIEQFCEYIGGHDDIWYATNIEIVDYVKAYKNLRFSADQHLVYNPSAQSVWVLLDEQPIEIPGGRTLTLF